MRLETAKPAIINNGAIRLAMIPSNQDGKGDKEGHADSVANRDNS